MASRLPEYVSPIVAAGAGIPSKHVCNCERFHAAGSRVRLHAYGDGGDSCAPICLVLCLVWSGLVFTDLW
jgi:hypothetical protein